MIKNFWFRYFNCRAQIHSFLLNKHFWSTYAQYPVLRIQNWKNNFLILRNALPTRNYFPWALIPFMRVLIL